jgi:SAM-dependent methyltransferase
VDLSITDKVVSLFRDKDSKKAHYRKLYEEHDFLTAYAKHTDMRVAENPKGAIGREDEWETHGKLQLDFLIREGLLPMHRLLDVGCGVGRFARKVVPFLRDGNYTGVDISAAALEQALLLSEREGWHAKHPRWLLTGDLLVDGMYDFIWAHSVFTHIAPQYIETVIRNAAPRMVRGGKFLFTFKRATTVQRSGLKQFQYPAAFFATIAARHGFYSEPLSYVFPAHQSTMRLTRLTDEPVEDEDEDE